MRMFSITCDIDNLTETKSWLESETGVFIFKELITFDQQNITIIACALNEETESYLILKYPNGVLHWA